MRASRVLLQYYPDALLPEILRALHQVMKECPPNSPAVASSALLTPLSPLSAHDSPSPVLLKKEVYLNAVCIASTEFLSLLQQQQQQQQQSQNQVGGIGNGSERNDKALTRWFQTFLVPELKTTSRAERVTRRSFDACP